MRKEEKSDESTSQRPKRSTCQKNLGIGNGLLWREENDLKRALYASLQETRKRNFDEEDESPEGETPQGSEMITNGNSQEDSPKKSKVHAQRKFAQGSTPNSPVLTPLKVPYANNSTTELLPCRRPKTEDFLTFLCLRGTAILPPSLDFLNTCSKSDTSSERSFSPDLEIKESKEGSLSKSCNIREKNSRQENGDIGFHRKSLTRKQQEAAETNLKRFNSNSKFSKEVSVIRKRKSREDYGIDDEEFLPRKLAFSRSKNSQVAIRARTRSTALHALREKYKRKRIDNDKKKVIPVKHLKSTGPSKSDKGNLVTRSQTLNKKSVSQVSKKNIAGKDNSSSETRSKKKLLDLNKRRSLRSANPEISLASRDCLQRRLTLLRKKTPWLRRAKLVPPIVDVDSDDEVLEIGKVSGSSRKLSFSNVDYQRDGSHKCNSGAKSEKFSGRLRSKHTSLLKTRCQAKSLALKKRFPIRQAAKKTFLHHASIKSKAISKRVAKQDTLKRIKKSVVILKTMSLRKDLQNKRVTRSAKHQIEEMLWSNPEKRAKVQCVKNITPKGDTKPANFEKHSLRKKDIIPSKSKEVVKLKRNAEKDPEKRRCRSLSTELAPKTHKFSDPVKDKDTVKIKDFKKTDKHSKGILYFDEKPCSVSIPKIQHPLSSVAMKTLSILAEDCSAQIEVKKEAPDSLKLDCRNSMEKNRGTNSSVVVAQKDTFETVQKIAAKKVPCIAKAVDSNHYKNLDDKMLPNNSKIAPKSCPEKGNLKLLSSTDLSSSDEDDMVLSLLCQVKREGMKHSTVSANHAAVKKEQKPNESSAKESKSHLKKESSKSGISKDKNQQSHKSHDKKSSKKHDDKESLKSHKKDSERGHKSHKKDIIKISKKDASDSKLEVIKNYSPLPSKDCGMSIPKVADSLPKSENVLKDDVKIGCLNAEASLNSLENSVLPLSKADSDIDIICTNSGDLLKEVKFTKKDSDKESQKSKKEGESHKHKKESSKEKKIKKDSDKDIYKNKSSDKDVLKSSKKEDKFSKKDSEKSLAKLLKKEREKDRSKSSKKEEKERSKHSKRDGSSSSKSSKRDSEKDGSKLSKKDSEKENTRNEKQDEFSGDILEVKKDKSSKKESSKSSRRNSYDEIKSPSKKKKKHENIDFEKIKNLINKSSLLNEFSAVKGFKRRSSSEKSELKKHISKSKKRKKLALLKDKKLSKKLSSKLLRKYSKEKGFKSKKNKLKKKELRKETINLDPFTVSEKTHSKNKKQKHKNKNIHRRDSQDKSKSSDATISEASVDASSVEKKDSELNKSFPSLTMDQNLTETVSSKTTVETTTNTIACTADTASSMYFVESISESIPPIDSMSAAEITQALPNEIVFAPPEEIHGLVSSEFSGVFDEAFSTGTILLTARDNISQVPMFLQDISVPKTMADAATNTGEDDLVEIVNPLLESFRSDEMSVGTQTVTPVGSPSPTVEMKSLLTAPAIEPKVMVQNRILVPKEVVLQNKVPVSKEVAVQNRTSESKEVVVRNMIPVSKEPVVQNRITVSKEVAAHNRTPIYKEVMMPPDTKVIVPEAPVFSPFTVPQTALPVKNKKKYVTFPKRHKSSNDGSQSKLKPFPGSVAMLVDAPVYRPTLEEFTDPLEYIYKIQPEAEKYGICKIVPPSSFKPECKVNDDMRFTAHNQYVHKMLYRWGPNVQHVACIKKHLKSQKVQLEQAPLIGGIELDISKFYHTVQQFGGLQQVIEKKKWQKVADAMRIPKTAQDRVTKLYDAYCKYLVSYDTLPIEEKNKLLLEVLSDHEKRIKIRNSPKDSEKEEDEIDDEENNDCVTKGRSMSLSNFFRVARNTMSMWYKNDICPEEAENEFWKLVTERQNHVVVHAGNIDSSVYQSGFPSNRNSPFAKHPWNLKVLTNNNNSILRCMGPVSGITIPTLHVGMLFTTGCWYRDPHSLPWVEYLHTGASKIWYGIPPNGCEKFREAMTKIMPECCTNNPIWLPSDTAMVPPDLLVKHGASLSRTVQKSGQFIVIFPESFTSTICCGYCVSESVYFAPTPWLDLAQKAFQDIKSSCEPPAFSLERLLFSIANDSKTQPETLQKILPMIKDIRAQELKLRAELSENGLKQIERLPLLEVRDKKKKSRGMEDESEVECEICRTHCYVSMVVNTQEDCIYCLPHALEHIQKKNLKICKLTYTYNEEELNELVKKIDEISDQLAKSSPRKKLPKKKTNATPEKLLPH